VNLEAEEKDHRGVPLPPEHEQVVPSAMEQDAEKSAEAKKADFSAVKKADEVEKVDEAMKTAEAKKAAAVKTAEAKKAATLKAAEAKKAVAVEKAAKANKKVADVA
jgi:colicin import membrane protein